MAKKRTSRSTKRTRKSALKKTHGADGRIQKLNQSDAYVNFLRASWEISQAAAHRPRPPVILGQPLTAKPVGPVRSTCSARNARRSVIIATGHGGINGAKNYSTRSKETCKK